MGGRRWAAELCPGIIFPTPYPQGYGATPRLPRARESYSRRAKEHASQGACTSTLRMAMAPAPYRLRPAHPPAPPSGPEARNPQTGGGPRSTAGGKGRHGSDRKAPFLVGLSSPRRRGGSATSGAHRRLPAASSPHLPRTPATRPPPGASVPASPAARTSAPTPGRAPARGRRRAPRPAAARPAAVPAPADPAAPGRGRRRAERTDSAARSAGEAARSRRTPPHTPRRPTPRTKWFDGQLSAAPSSRSSLWPTAHPSATPPRSRPAWPP